MTTRQGVGFFRATFLVAKKDLVIELRTKEIVTTAAFFSVLVVVIAALAFSTTAAADVQVAPGTIWIAIAFSGVLALARTFHREREDGAMMGLLASPMPRGAFFLGKAVGVLGFLFAVEAVVVPTAGLLFHIDLLKVLGPLVLVLVAGSIGMAACGTLFGAMTVRTRARELVLSSVLFPLISPAILCSVSATRQVFLGDPARELGDWLLLLGVFDCAALAGGLALFGTLVDE